MSWRKFVVLCNGLSGDSVYINVMHGRKSGKMPIDCSKPENHKQAERIVDRYFGGSGKGKK